MRRSVLGRQSLARPVLVGVLHVLLLGLTFSCLLLVAPGGERSGASGSPDGPAPSWRLTSAGVPAPGTPLFTEDFSAQAAFGGGIDIRSYVGPRGMTYSADSQYTPSANYCDGWVMSSISPRAGQDSRCDGPTWSILGQMAQGLGYAQGVDGGSNQALAENTNTSTSGRLPAGYVLRTNSSASGSGGHYYTVSAYAAEAHCEESHASLTLSLIVNGAERQVSSGFDPCTAPGGVNYSQVRVARMQSAVVKAPGGNPLFGLSLYNAQTSGNGNDFAVDKLQITDVTPTLSKAFLPASISLGDASTLTFTVTNTSDLAAKTDWNLADDLPEGLTVVGGAVGGTCAQRAGYPYVVSAAAGGRTIGVTGGDLAAGEASCTITVPVTADRTGTFVNGPSNVVTDLIPPTDAALTVERPLQQAAWTLDKRVVAGGLVDSNGNGRTDAGDTIRYEFLVSNTGNVVLRNPRVTDPKLARAGVTITCPDRVLAPGASTVCTTSKPYVVAQADVDAGGVTNTATAVAVPPADVDRPGPVTDTNVVPVDPGSRVAAWGLDKRVAAGGVVDVNRNGVTDAGDTIAYEFEVTNTGTVTLRNPRVRDPRLARAGITIACPDLVLAPAASTVCVTSAPYVVTAADVAAGGVTNTATAVATPPAGVSSPDPVTDTVTVPTGATGHPAWTLDKRIAAGGLVDVNGNGRIDAGDTVAYEFRVTNTGGVALSGLRISDPKLAGFGITITCPTTDLPVGASVVCTASEPYVVTQADVDAGGVRNTATATATSRQGSATLRRASSVVMGS